MAQGLLGTCRQIRADTSVQRYLWNRLIALPINTSIIGLNQGVNFKVDPKPIFFVGLFLLKEKPQEQGWFETGY